MCQEIKQGHLNLHVNTLKVGQTILSISSNVWCNVVGTTGWLLFFFCICEIFSHSGHVFKLEALNKSKATGTFIDQDIISKVRLVLLMKAMQAYSSKMLSGIRLKQAKGYNMVNIRVLEHRKRISSLPVPGVWLFRAVLGIVVCSGHVCRLQCIVGSGVCWRSKQWPDLWWCSHNITCFYSSNCVMLHFGLLNH